jgi:hypothetical protein
MLEKYEDDAVADAELAYATQANDRAQALHFREMSELLTRMRLMYARLEPHLTIESRSLPRAARSITSRLFEESEVDERLETFSSRLEALEDLYEDGLDRSVEHRWYVASQRLELGIILLLFIEIGVLTTELYLTLLR